MNVIDFNNKILNYNFKTDTCKKYSFFILVFYSWRDLGEFNYTFNTAEETINPRYEASLFVLI